MRHKKVKRREQSVDKVYQHPLVSKLINRIMKDGKKTVAESLVYQTFDLLQEKGQDPIDTFEKALQNVGPKYEVKARRIGGANYQVPTEVRGDRKLSLAIRWIVEAASARPNTEHKGFAQKLAAELQDALANQGAAIKKKDNVLRMVEANRAFAHFRW